MHDTVLAPLLDERSERELAARIEAAQANLLRTTARIERARLAVAQARNDLQRSEQLAQQGFVAPTRLDTERLAVLATQREVEATEQERQQKQSEAQRQSTPTETDEARATDTSGTAKAATTRRASSRCAHSQR